MLEISLQTTVYSSLPRDLYTINFAEFSDSKNSVFVCRDIYNSIVGTPIKPTSCCIVATHWCQPVYVTANCYVKVQSH